MKTLPSRVERLRNELARDRLEERARIDAVIADFGGGTDAPAALRRMAEEVAYWRIRMQLISDVVAKVRSEEPFAVLGAGPHWRTGRAQAGMVALTAPV
jgi:hypothetical protein